MNGSSGARLVWLTVGMCSATGAQTVGPQAMKNELLDLRAREVLKNYPDDKDAEIAVMSLTELLKTSNALKSTVVLPCPPAPPPVPSGRVPKIASASE